MRNRFIAVSVVVALSLLGVSEPAFAQGTGGTGELMLSKLFRGVVNLVTGWIEIPMQMSDTWKLEGPATGLSWGFVKGIGFALGRTAAGAYETVTFPVPLPEGYEPIMHPEFVLSR